MRPGNLGDIATDNTLPGTRFRDDWLDEIPEVQWPAYIDDSAELLQRGIKIGDTELTSGDFASETAKYYRSGLAASGDINSNSTSLPLGNVRDVDLGAVAWAFTKLKREIHESKHTNFKNTSRAIEAVLNKSLLASVEEGLLSGDQIETIRLPENADVVDLVYEVFCRPRSQGYVDSLIELARESRAEPGGLLQRLEEPRMVTTLWPHQREALSSWLEHDCRGYVDMATATGKTVLGLAAIAHHFGRVHPQDSDVASKSHRPTQRGRSTVLVIAHRDIILDQWKREFDHHLNIPEQSSTRDGAHTVSFEWGDIHFWTPKRALERGVPNADLVILDEMHHYLGSSGFGSILDETDGHLLALSGSVEGDNERTLERRELPKIFEFSLQDGQELGIIPHCSWDICYAPYESHSALTEVTERYRNGYESYHDGPSEVNLNKVDGYEKVDFEFETMSEARSVVQSNAGKSLKEYDYDFREFTSSVKSRQLTRYSLSPTLTAISDLVLEHIYENKCVVLLESGDEVSTIESTLKRELSDEHDELVYSVSSDDSDDALSIVESFDDHCEHGALIGTGNTLGEGVDIKTADVGINRGRGRLSRSLIQRFGRILRNPTGDKRAQFHHIVSLPTESEAMLPIEDGIDLLEMSSQLLAWGNQFDAQPIFHAGGDQSAVRAALAKLEQAGANGIQTRRPDKYEFSADSATKDRLEELLEKIDAVTDESVLLKIERETNSRSDGPNNSSSDEESLISGYNRPSTIQIDKWVAQLLSHVITDKPVGTVISQAVRHSLQSDSTTVEYRDRLNEHGHTASLNPALSVLAANAAGSRNSGRIGGFVQAAIIEYLYESSEISFSVDHLPEVIAEPLNRYQSTK
ncbi:DEAD/DEAH box helicase [Haloprofundus marisrubri]|uniref:DEAD/DEAH box helicase n=1 Tax=Haloprofundus marisrubri TaxID=1514971 RepID=UPI0009E1CD09|nr:DEAD/DEAH box helicase family protein [Haloprofundus marisrubri]